MLGVKHGQMLIGDRFEFVRVRQPRQRSDLIGVQIMGRRDAREAQRQDMIRPQANSRR